MPSCGGPRRGMMLTDGWRCCRQKGPKTLIPKKGDAEAAAAAAAPRPSPASSVVVVMRSLQLIESHSVALDAPLLEGTASRVTRPMLACCCNSPALRLPKRLPAGCDRVWVKDG